MDRRCLSVLLVFPKMVLSVLSFDGVLEEGSG